MKFQIICRNEQRAVYNQSTILIQRNPYILNMKYMNRKECKKCKNGKNNIKELD